MLARLLTLAATRSTPATTSALLAARGMAAPQSVMMMSSPVMTVPATRAVHTIKADKDGRKTNKYQTMLKAKRRRIRRGKTGAAPRGLATFSTYAGFRKDVSFLPRKFGFWLRFMQDDPRLVVPVEPLTATAPAAAPTVTAANASEASAPVSSSPSSAANYTAAH
ncbi:hypothetical protein BC828DRAFT_389340 [Blastocladiella britannica]|nr:hypothetical protein BC828DRAFT_389340 [Blastocladiella britannica]